MAGARPTTAGLALIVSIWVEEIMSKRFRDLPVAAKLGGGFGVLVFLMAVLGVQSYRALGDAAQLARASNAETTAVEILRDSNSRNFEADRSQYLALHARTAKD